jgi:hypothetical protein
VPLSLVFFAPVPAWEAFQRYTALRVQGSGPVLRALGVRPGTDVDAVGSGASGTRVVPLTAA